MARVKLTSWSNLVKPDREVLKIAGVTAVLAVLALLAAIYFTDRHQERMDSFGNGTAKVLAELAAEPVHRQDRLHLGVIGNRLADLPQVSAVASYTLDNQELASTGNLRSLDYAHPVTVDGSIVGYVRVGLDPEAFAESNAPRLVAALLILLLLPLAVASGWALAEPGRRAEIRARLPRLPERLPWNPGRLPTPAPAADESLTEAEPEEVVHYLLAINLHNQLTLPTTEREFELSLCVELAESVAALYHGQVVGIPGLGAVVNFDHIDEPDRPFQIVCAALVLARLLREEAPFGVYRLGLNLIRKPADEPLPLNDAAVSDAALLSALARDATLAVSGSFSSALGGHDRMTLSPLENPLLDELAGGSDACFLVTGLNHPFATGVTQQAEQLRSQRAGIESPSTF
jgi:uncharacterized membrane protein affecting hemolysin expression